MIAAEGLTKRYGSVTAVDDLSFDVLPGRVTGFVGPNGAGKTTTLRMALGLDAPTAGRVTIDGRPYGAYRRPLFEVGALIDAQALHGGRSAAQHLLALAHSNGIPGRRVQQVLKRVGLGDVAGRRVGGFSLGMRQRLGIAAALLGDPPVLILDEPVNGLDPEGIVWIRTLLKSLATEGRTVFVSSHLMSEMAQTADHLVVIGRGRLLADSSVEAFVGRTSRNEVRVVTPQSTELAGLLTDHGVHVRAVDGERLVATGTDVSTVGRLAADHRIVLLELAAQSASLEEAFMELTRDSADHTADFGNMDGAA
ncbi:ABC transporter ATP-binding protein [Streptomyces spinosirectus]|uniref:ABC transporter ATP-binding protein n=1 Tax=Streptomyces TaxID=1883 RepID=UPI001C9DC72C|nr:MULTISPECIES: ABC transporter ATP-binding protein [Streptomyces]MBY8343039.1 ABC transporter ATP-binding protein [Streptomyces plumbidurans]UIR19168.1 ABC transporter ATP-binding protein [Streptomyces spinosirectus]